MWKNWNCSWHCDVSSLSLITVQILCWQKWDRKLRAGSARHCPPHTRSTLWALKGSRGKTHWFQISAEGQISPTLTARWAGKASTLVSCIVTAQNWCRRETKKKKENSFTCFFSRKQCFYRNNFRMANSTRTSTQEKEKGKFFVVLKWKSRKVKWRLEWWLSLFVLL